MKFILTILLAAFCICACAQQILLTASKNATTSSGGGGGGTTTFSDTFNRVGENPLSDSGAWDATGGIGQPSISVSGLNGLPNANAETIVSTPTFSANQKSTLVLSQINVGTGGGGPGVRWDTSANGYFVYIASSTKLQVYKNVPSNIPVQLGSDYTISALNIGDAVSISVSGTTLTVYVNGTQQGSTITDSTYSSGQPAIYIFNNDSVLFASFSATTIP